MFPRRRHHVELLEENLVISVAYVRHGEDEFYDEPVTEGEKRVCADGSSSTVEKKHSAPSAKDLCNVVPRTLKIKHTTERFNWLWWQVGTTTTTASSKASSVLKHPHKPAPFRKLGSLGRLLKAVVVEENLTVELSFSAADLAGRWKPSPPPCADISRSSSRTRREEPDSFPASSSGTRPLTARYVEVLAKRRRIEAGSVEQDVIGALLSKDVVKKPVPPTLRDEGATSATASGIGASSSGDSSSLPSTRSPTSDSPPTKR